jgi:hypothetical protein
MLDIVAFIEDSCDERYHELDQLQNIEPQRKIVGAQRATPKNIAGI